MIHVWFCYSQEQVFSGHKGFYFCEAHGYFLGNIVNTFELGACNTI